MNEYFDYLAPRPCCEDIVKIVKIRPIVRVRVTTDSTDENEYIRYGPECWYVQIGESDEPVYDCRELEILYQEFIKKYNVTRH